MLNTVTENSDYNLDHQNIKTDLGQIAKTTITIDIHMYLGIQTLCGTVFVVVAIVIVILPLYLVPMKTGIYKIYCSMPNSKC